METPLLVSNRHLIPVSAFFIRSFLMNTAVKSAVSGHGSRDCVLRPGVIYKAARTPPGSEMKPHRPRFASVTSPGPRIENIMRGNHGF